MKPITFTFDAKTIKTISDGLEKLDTHEAKVIYNDIALEVLKQLRLERPFSDRNSETVNPTTPPPNPNASKQ